MAICLSVCFCLFSRPFFSFLVKIWAALRRKVMVAREQQSKLVCLAKIFTSWLVTAYALEVSVPPPRISCDNLRSDNIELPQRITRYCPLDGHATHGLWPRCMSCGHCIAIGARLFFRLCWAFLPVARPAAARCARYLRLQAASLLWCQCLVPRTLAS